ncbi:MAG TPA: MMPL family transporter, partial [Candidatus Xenobia bacterium]
MFPAADWGRRIARRPWPIVGFWMVCWLLAWPASRLTPAVLHGGGRPIAGSPSAALDAILERDFAGASFLHPVLVVFSEPRLTVHDPAYARAVQQVQAHLPELAPVESTRSFLQGEADKLTSDDGHITVLLVGMRGSNPDEAEAAIPALRQALAALRPSLGLPDLTTLVTSDTAVDEDIDTLSAQDSARAERRTLPFVLVCLLAAFGALGAATLPLLVGLLSVTVTGAVVFLVGHVLSLTILIQNTASMIGLGTSIDYALVMVSRFREERSAGHAVGDAVGTTVATAGRAVVGSGAMVVVGMVSLLFSPLQDIRSMALGCILVVTVGVTVSLSLLPAVLSLLGDRVGRARPSSPDDGWMRWAERLVAHPGAALTVGLGLVGLVSWPAWHLRTDLMEGTWMPPQAESRQGYDA